MVSIGSNVGPPQYNASILTRVSVLTVVSVLVLLLWLYHLSQYSAPCVADVCVGMTHDVLLYDDKLATCTSQEKRTQYPRSNRRPVSSFSSFVMFC